MRIQSQVFLSAVLVVCLPVFSSCGSQPEFTADLVLTNARIFTVNDDNLWAEAVAIKDGRFLYVGDDKGVMQFIGDGTREVDLAGRFVIPGLIDGHTHPGLIGIEQYGPRLPETSREDFLAAVKERAENSTDAGWLQLCCWPNSLYVSGRDGPNKRELDAIVPDRPVWITSRSWHSYWLNSKGLEVLGVDEHTQDPRPGVAVYARDEQGELTGWIKEGAGWQHFEEHFKVDPDQHKEGMESFLKTLSEHGVTTVYDGGNMGYEDHVYSYLAELEQSGRLPVRYEGTYQIFIPDRKHRAIEEMKRLRKTYGGQRLRFRTIKLFMDGINSNRSGAMLQPYADIPDYESNTMMTEDELRDFLLELHEEKFDLHVHVIGDLATRTVLDAVESATAAVSGQFYPRVTLAHLQIIDTDDYARFPELGVSANFTPWWHGMDENLLSDPALGEERYSRAFTLKPLFDAGANVTFSSDDWRLPVVSPFLGMQVGYTRRDPEKSSTDNRPDPSAIFDGRTQLLSKFAKPELEQMIRGYTINGAYPLRMEDQLGSIEEGKIADLLVLNENLFEIDPGKIHKSVPAVVIMEGQVIHGDLMSSP